MHKFTSSKLSVHIENELIFGTTLYSYIYVYRGRKYRIEIDLQYLYDMGWSSQQCWGAPIRVIFPRKYRIEADEKRNEY